MDRICFESAFRLTDRLAALARPRERSGEVRLGLLLFPNLLETGWDDDIGNRWRSSLRLASVITRIRGEGRETS